MTYRIDLHVHTGASPDGLSSLAELARAAKAAGLDAIAVTDHNLCTPAPAALEGVALLPGCEVSTAAGHILGLFLDSPLDLDGLRREGLPSGRDAVEEIHRRGGIAVLAHPYEKPGARPRGFDFLPDCVECANARAGFKVRRANDLAADLAEYWGVPAVGGSDAHSRREVGNAYTEVEAESLTAPALREALLGGRCRPVLARETSCLGKGLSQFGKRRRQGGLKNLAIGAAYVAYCAGRDVGRTLRTFTGRGL